MSQKYIHYGSNTYDPIQFHPICNRPIPWVKPEPSTGLWGSPINSSQGWYDWCQDNDYKIDKLDRSFIFELKPDARILYIRNNEELHSLPKEYLDRPKIIDGYYLKDLYCFDFEKLLQVYNYDAIEVHVTTHDIYMNLYGWDCDSILVLNPDAIIQVKE